MENSKVIILVSPYSKNGNEIEIVVYIQRGNKRIPIELPRALRLEITALVKTQNEQIINVQSNRRNGKTLIQKIEKQFKEAMFKAEAIETEYEKYCDYSEDELNKDFIKYATGKKATAPAPGFKQKFKNFNFRRI